MRAMGSADLELRRKIEEVVQSDFIISNIHLSAMSVADACTACSLE